MMVFLFIFSLGVHMFIPLYDSIGMALTSGENVGAQLGRFNSVRVAFGLVAGGLAFFGFRSGFFSFKTPIIVNFIIAGVILTVITGLLIYLLRLRGDYTTKRTHFVLRKDYIKYYILASLFAGRKQIAFVFGPWVLIELFSFPVENMVLVIMAGSAISVFLIPKLGKLTDKYGAPKMMIVEVITFILLYLGYGIISAQAVQGAFVGAAFTVALVVTIGVHLFDRVSFNFSMVRSIYVRSIAKEPGDVTPTLATGMAFDHVFSILASIVCGWIWIEFGPQYVFVFSGVMAVAQLVVALKIKKDYKREESL
jgi:MFS family permease